MAGKSVPVVIVPRFTTYAGAGSFDTEAIAVSRYASLGAVFWRAALLGAGAGLAIAVAFEESNDGDSYSTCGGGPWVIPAAGQESFMTVAFTKAWLRFRTILTGTNPVVTCRLAGAFELRER